MRTTTKLMALGLAATGLLLNACEIPGGGQPPRTIVIPNPGVERTPFSGFPATFQGTNIIQDQGEITSQDVISPYDAFTTQVNDDLTVRFTCSVSDEETTIYVDWGAADDFFFCDDTPHNVTVDAGQVYIEIHNYSHDAGLHPYVVNADPVVE
jgi:hypothetical protein